MMSNEKLNDDVKFTAARQRIACPTDEVLCLIQIQFQSDGERQCRRFGRFVGWIISDFGKQFSINIGLLIDLHICFTHAIN